MIHKLGTAALTSHREFISSSSDSPEIWGSWYNRRFVLLSEISTFCIAHTLSYRFYSLEVAQEPIRARMCGFGDKVRQSIAYL